MEGYKSMWSRAAMASGYQVASVAPAAPPVAASKKKQRNEEFAERTQPEQPREAPRVRTTVTAASLMPIPLTPAPRSNNKRGSIAGEYFSFGFRWPETVRSSGHYFPAD
jgi:hypothetical protein